MTIQTDKFNVTGQPEPSQSAYENFLARKVEVAREQVKAGLVYTEEEVEKEFASRRGSNNKE